MVVNCFQKLLSSWHDTTALVKWSILRLLWIAFKNYYLRDTTQPPRKLILLKSCCELLSKIIIFVTRHNATEVLTTAMNVVNCFQKLLSSWHDTTAFKVNGGEVKLWIAFKNYYLRDTTQRLVKRGKPKTCCELLSKIIIFVTRHNLTLNELECVVVVNCFQKLLSSWHDTTNFGLSSRHSRLWIAFKNYYLRDTTQRLFWISTVRICCELLSKIIIFVTRHNYTYTFSVCYFVVNCFQKLLSSWHDTTYICIIITTTKLWIAFKNYYLRDTTQRVLVPSTRF